MWRGGKIAAPTLTAGVWSVFPKFFANVGRGLNHVYHETLDGIRDSKWHWNPKNWNLKPRKYSKTKESFAKAFSWNKKGIPAGKTMEFPTTKKETKVIDITTTKEEKKAA